MHWRGPGYSGGLRAGVIRTLGEADRNALATFDEVIDVRSPGEFAEDHIPGAINLPVLNDGERAFIGTIYVQKSRFEARRLGAAIVARNIAAHLDGALGAKTPSFAPLVYCWRGGQRSAAMATVLDQVGWRPTLLAGGYRTYRREVCARLNDALPRVVLLGGHTGTAKTAMLSQIASRGVQVIDLEGLAHHRGSLLGNIPGEAQPSQKMFESRLNLALAALDASRPVLMEAESSKIGNINIPETLWKAMGAASMIEVRAPIPVRARYLVSAYQDLTADPKRLIAALGRLPARYGRAALEVWRDLARLGEYEALAMALMEAHYDPAYARWNRNHPRPCLETIELQEITETSVSDASAQIAKRLHGLEVQ